MKVYIRTFGAAFTGSSTPDSPLDRPWDLCINVQHLVDPNRGRGTDPKVQQDFIEKNPEAVDFIAAFADYMVHLAFAQSGFNEAAIAINCFAGHSRSVALAEILADSFRKERGYAVEVVHLTIGRKFPDAGEGEEE